MTNLVMWQACARTKSREKFCYGKHVKKDQGNGA